MRPAVPVLAARSIRLFFCIGALILTVAGPAAAANAEAGSTSAAPAEDPFFDELYEEAESSAVTVYDPLEPVNRVLFQVNDRLYFWVIKPAATGYRTVLPVEIRMCVKNFFYNLLSPIRIVNCLLQGKAGGAGSELMRLTINTTAGVGGLADVADRYPQLERRDEDLGQTLAVYGVKNGVFLVLPFMGPSTFRDALSWIGDRYLSPVTWTVEDLGTGVAVLAGRKLNDVSFRIGDYEALKAASLDPYAAMRDGYVQFRNKEIAD